MVWTATPAPAETQYLELFCFNATTKDQEDFGHDFANKPPSRDPRSHH